MWQVLRRYQGVDPNQQQQQQKSISVHINNDKAFQHNQRTLALHEWKEHQVNPNPPSLAMPYDRYVFEKMLRLAVNTSSTRISTENQEQQQQSSNSVEVQRRSLFNLVQLLFEKPQNIHHLTKEPALLPTIVATTRDPDEEVRRTTCILLRLMAQDRKGAEFLFNTRKDEPIDETLIHLVAVAKNNAISKNNAHVVSDNDKTKKEDVRRRLADVGEAVRCILLCCLDASSCKVSTEALKAMVALHGKVDAPEYTITLMRARIVPVYAEIVRAFRVSSTSSNEEDEEEQRILCCTSALICLRLVTNAKEAYLEVLNEGVLDSALQNIVIDYTASLLANNNNAENEKSSTTSTPSAKLLSAALSVITELVLYTAGSNTAAKRQDSKLPTLLPCAKLARHHPDPAVRRDAAGTLATLCVSEIGKAAAHGAPQEQGVIDLVKDSILQETDRDVVSSMCRVVCLLSELPAARQQLVDVAGPLKEIAENAAKSKDASLEEGAARAAKLVVWVPGQE